MPEIWVEKIRWDVPKIAKSVDGMLNALSYRVHTSNDLENSRARWLIFRHGVLLSVKLQNFDPPHLEGQGFRIGFRAPKINSPIGGYAAVQQGDLEIWYHEDPRLTFLPTEDFDLDSDRQQMIMSALDTINERAAKDYGLEVGGDPLSYVFPRRDFASVSVLSVREFP